MTLRLILTDGSGVQALAATFGAIVQTNIIQTAADAAAAAASATSAANSAINASSSASAAAASASSAAAQASAASTSASNAAASATAAGTSETNAANSASAASTSATNAAGSATAAATSATNAANSATAAATSASNAAATLANALTKANNLSDVASVTTAATNLGLGTGNTPTFTNVKLSGSTVHGVAIGQAGSALAYVAPGSTAGLPLVTNGSATDPTYQILPISGGGTGSSTAAAALAALGTQPTNNPTFTGNVGVPTRTAGDNTANAASTAFVTAAVAPMVGKNKFINGSMSIDQRNGGAAQTFTAGAALAYSVDRWYGYCTGANVTGQQVAGSSRSRFRYRFTGAASVTGIGFGQRIEAANSYDLNGQTATLSVDLANSLLTTVTWTAYYANTTDTFGTLASPTRTQIATGTFTVTSTVTRYSTQISVPAAATTGIEVVFSVGAQTSGTWTIGDAQLEWGSVVTPLERRKFTDELLDCQRYLYRVGSGSGTEGVGVGLIQSSTVIIALVFLPVKMRIKTQALLTSNMVGTSAGSAVNGSSQSVTWQGDQCITYQLTASGAAWTPGQAGLVYANSGFFQLDAEL